MTGCGSRRSWNERLDEAGKAKDIPNPAFATREGCWQGEAGFANVVAGRSHNGNASVLDPVACEVILRMFTPREGRRVYNPFGGGVQSGYIAGACAVFSTSPARSGRTSVTRTTPFATEFPDVQWVQADSSNL